MNTVIHEKFVKISNQFVQDVFDSLKSHQRDWVGLYWVESFINSDQPNSDDLLVGAFIGPDTPHKRIKMGEGLCSLAVERGQTINEKDVKANERFLACSSTTESELIIPISVRFKVVGELDIDSNQYDAFDKDTEANLERLCADFGKKLETLLVD
ncbi:MAG: hypothetical protein KDD25_08400 [Bdellovibrionales bacterium]|nr:hypothetical protein [Bdellovibrionales bacterium]